MFESCSSLIDLDISNFDFKGINIKRMFYYCNKDLIKKVKNQNYTLRKKAYEKKYNDL